MNTTKSEKLVPSDELYKRVRAEFLMQGTSFNKWCVENNITRQAAASALQGFWKGPAAKRLVADIKKAAGIKEG